MKRPLAVLIAIALLLAACAPAAAPTGAPTVATREVEKAITKAPEPTREAPAAAQPAQPTSAPAVQPAPAQPTQAPAPTEAPAAPPQPTPKILATALPEFRPPKSGGVLTPPTVVPTLTGNSSVTSGQPPLGWNTYRDQVTGVSFQYPRDWATAIGRNNQGTVASIVVIRPGQPITNAASIVIDVRQKQGDLLAWLNKQLPTGLLLIDAKALENANSAKSYNAQVGSRQAVFLYAPAHGKINDVAELHTGDNQYFYQVTYLGSAPDNLDYRTAFLHVLNTLILTGTTTSGVTLPTTTFTNGVDPVKWK